MKLSVIKVSSAVMFAVVILFLSNLNAFSAIQNKCKDQASGLFKFSVEPAIEITSTGDVDLGGICPGCCKKYDCCYTGDQPHILFTAIGAFNCPYKMDWWETPSAPGIDLPLGINWKNLAGNWVPWPNPNQPHQFLPVPGQAGMGISEWAVFICTQFCVGCDVAPGEYSKTVTMTVEYACAQ